ncbi:MAG: hypothetical protein N2C12_13275 [Planctomycetales bacterium]
MNKEYNEQTPKWKLEENPDIGPLPARRALENGACHVQQKGNRQAA